MPVMTEGSDIVPMSLNRIAVSALSFSCLTRMQYSQELHGATRNPQRGAMMRQSPTDHAAACWVHPFIELCEGAYDEEGYRVVIPVTPENMQIIDRYERGLIPIRGVRPGDQMVLRRPTANRWVWEVWRRSRGTDR